MKQTVLSHREFAESCEELARLTGRPLGDVAAGLAGNVVVKEAEASLERVDVRGYASAIASATAEHQCSVSQAIQLVNVKDFVRGVR